MNISSGEMVQLRLEIDLQRRRFEQQAIVLQMMIDVMAQNPQFCRFCGGNQGAVTICTNCFILKSYKK